MFFLKQKNWNLAFKYNSQEPKYFKTLYFADKIFVWEQEGWKRWKYVNLKWNKLIKSKYYSINIDVISKSSVW